MEAHKVHTLEIAGSNPASATNYKETGNLWKHIVKMITLAKRPSIVAPVEEQIADAPIVGTATLAIHVLMHRSSKEGLPF